jgi:hypothetical protein
LGLIAVVVVWLAGNLAISLLIVVGVLLKPSTALAEARWREGFELKAVDVTDVVCHLHSLLLLLREPGLLDPGPLPSG